MTLAGTMTRDAETIPPQATLQLAAQRMKELNVGALSVYERPVNISTSAEPDRPALSTLARCGAVQR